MTLVRAVARRVLPLRVRRWLGPRLLGSAQRGVPASAGYEVVTGPAAQEQHNAWLDPVVAERQDLAFAPLLEAMYRGEPRADFVALAEAVRRTGSENASILEVGCGSGWNGRVLAHLLGHAVAYSGLDYSPAMVSLGRRYYPGTPFLVGDATRLPMAAGAVEIALSGTVLMHVLDYRAAIRETRRAARHWCIFHTVPVLASRETTVLRKLAYGGPVLEVVFNEGALMEEFRASGLAVRHVLDSIPYNLAAVLGEPTVTKTYVCEAL